MDELDEGVTALYCAAENRYEANNAEAVARLLLECRANINAHNATASSKKNKHGLASSPLHLRFPKVSGYSPGLL